MRTETEIEQRRAFVAHHVFCWCGRVLDQQRIVRVRLVTPNDMQETWACGAECRHVAALRARVEALRAERPELTLTVGEGNANE